MCVCVRPAPPRLPPHPQSHQARQGAAIAGGEPPTVRAAVDERTGEPKVLRPEMIVGLLLEMATGDENMLRPTTQRSLFW